jgi:hypothetical protein
VQALLAHGAQPNLARKDTGATPLYRSARTGNLRAVQQLAVFGASTTAVRYPAHTPAPPIPLHPTLTLTVRLSHLSQLPIVCYVTTLKATTGETPKTPQVIASERGHTAVSEWLQLVATWSPFRIACASRLHGVRCAFSDRSLHSRMPLDPTHVRFKRTCVRPMSFLSEVHSSYRVAL